MPLVRVYSVQEAVQYLKKGELVIYPTETSYGLGADALNVDAVKKVYKAKGRKLANPLSVIVSSLFMAKKYAIFSNIAKNIAKKYWPGAVTLALPAKSMILARTLKSKDKTIAVRVSTNRTARALAKSLNHPIIATSANKSGGSDSYSASDISKAFSKVNFSIYFLNKGTLSRRLPTTIIKITGNDFSVIRQGGQKIKFIK